MAFGGRSSARSCSERSTGRSGGAGRPGGSGG